MDKCNNKNTKQFGNFILLISKIYIRFNNNQGKIYGGHSFITNRNLYA